MAYRNRRRAQRAARRRAAKGGRRVYGRRRQVIRNRANDVAGLSETIPFTVRSSIVPPTQVIPSFSVTANNVVWTMADVSLGSFLRAPQVAQAYQFYKIKYFELKILPGQDTFTPGSSSAKPYFYYMVDKGNALPLTLTQNQMRAMGAKPIALDEKPIVIRWKPAVTLSTELNTLTGTTSAQMYKVSPYLNCDENPVDGAFNPSQVVHNGIKVFAENDGASLNFRGTLTAHFQFKKPAIPASAG